MANHDIVPTHLAVMAMRDNGYNNIAYAIAELIDNSIQAGATSVELLCADKEEFRLHRRTSQVSQIAVLDNGSGMNPDVLRMALQFGNGTYLDEDKHTGIGRFGMGLPSSSISQCRRVDVWTWQNGAENAIHSFLDLDDISAGNLQEVPEPTKKAVPSIWHQVGKTWGKTGTLVVWSEIDRSMWRRSDTIVEKSEFLIGRIYRRFLNDGRATIRLVTFETKSPHVVSEKFARPNDPLYLMSNTSAPGYSPFIAEGEPMFVQWGDSVVYKIRFRGTDHDVTVRFSIAKTEARKGDSPGARAHGVHARNNVGVSIMRADRELALDPSWANPSEPRDRWWGVEVDFPPALDELFGVTNNKQSARHFSELAKTSLDDLLAGNGSIGSARDQYEADEDPQWPLFELASVVRKQINAMQDILRKMKEGQRTQRDISSQGGADSPEAKATEVTNRRKSEGHIGQSDKQEDLSDDQKKEDVAQSLLTTGVAQEEEEANRIAAEIVARSYKYEIQHAAISSSPAFFDVQSRGGKIIVVLNTNHPVYEQLVEVLEADFEGSSEDDLKQRLVRASDSLDLLISAWARYEDEQPTGARLDKARDARWDWGRMARDFLKSE